jgi:hypothetical protein
MEEARQFLILTSSWKSSLLGPAKSGNIETTSSSTEIALPLDLGSLVSLMKLRFDPSE